MLKRWPNFKVLTVWIYFIAITSSGSHECLKKTSKHVGDKDYMPHLDSDVLLEAVNFKGLVCMSITLDHSNVCKTQRILGALD